MRTKHTSSSNSNRRTNNPVVGLKVIEEVTVNAAVGELTPSVKVTVLLPEVEAGTVNVADKLPVEVVVEGLKVTAVPPKIAVTECEASMPVAVKVTVEPTAPVVGVKVIAVTVNVADPVLPLPSVAETV